MNARSDFGEGFQVEKRGDDFQILEDYTPLQQTDMFLKKSKTNFVCEIVHQNVFPL